MIRPATADDFEGVFALGLRRVLGSKRYEAQRIEREASKRTYASLMQSPLVVSFVATDDYGLVVGYISACVSPQLWNEDAVANVVWIMAEQGYGMALVDALEQHVAALGVKEINLRIGYGERPDVYARKFKSKGYRIGGANFYKELKHG